jgi:hypothetical protein
VTSHDDLNAPRLQRRIFLSCAKKNCAFSREDTCGATTTTRPKLIVRARHRHSRYVAEATPPLAQPVASRARRVQSPEKQALDVTTHVARLTRRGRRALEL